MARPRGRNGIRTFLLFLKAPACGLERTSSQAFAARAWLAASTSRGHILTSLLVRQATDR